jgi:hypothetical protein
MKAACPNCGGNDFHQIMPYQNQSRLLDGCDISQCETCEIHFITPAPDQESWLAYNRSYFESAHSGLNLAPMSVIYHQAMAKIRVKHILESIGTSNPPASVLEIGPGVGYFARYWKTCFPECDYYALESDTSLHSCLRENGIQVLEDGIEQLENRPIDMCVMSHVLEHVINPSDTLRYVTEPLRKNGLLFVEVPCLDFLYKDVHEPHMIFFSESSLADCAKRAGYDGLKLSFHGDRISSIRRYDLPRRILVKLSRLTNIQLTHGFGPSDNTVKYYNLTDEEALAVAQTRPFVGQNEPSRWLRMIARKQ